MAPNGEVTAVLISHRADIHAVDKVRMEFVYTFSTSCEVRK